MEVKIEVGKPVRMDADTSGPAYHVYPVTVTGAGKGIQRTTLSVGGSQVAEHHTGRIVHQVSERDFPAGTHDLFASVTDGSATQTAKAQLQTAKAAAEAMKSTPTTPAAPSAPAR